MSAVTPYLEQKRSERKPNELPSVTLTAADLKGLNLGALPTDADGQPLDPLAKPHTELSRLLWARSLIAQALVGATFKLDIENAKVMVVASPAVKREVVSWSWSAHELERFSLFSTNSKMNCPTFDLPSGIGQLGGSCPGAAFAQSTVPLALLETEGPGPKYGEVKMTEKMRKGLGFLINEVQKDWASLPKNERAAPIINLNSTVCTRCVAGDTLVMVRNEGLQRIADLVGRESFEVWSGFGWRKTHAIMTKLSETVEVRFAGGRALRCTPDHPIMTTDGEVQAQHLIAGEHRVLPQLPDEPSFPSARALPAVELGAQHFNEKRGELPTEWTRELGVWLGYLMGDGWFLEAQRYPTLGICAAPVDMGDLERLADLVAPWSGGRAEVSLQDTGGTGEVGVHGQIARVYWRQKALTAFLRALGFTKQGELSVPREVWNASQEGVAGFLSGLFSTDGSVARWPKRVAVSFANTSRRLCDEVQQLLFAFGIRANICEYTSNAKRGFKRMWKVDIVAHESVLRFERAIGFFNERKAKALRAGLDEVGERKSLARPVSVESVLPASDLEPVFDLVDVGDEHQFIANGIPVHNCYASGGKYGEAVVQFSEVARMALVQGMLAQGREADLIDLLVRVIEDTLTWNKDDVKRHGIRPIRVHSSGDFYSPKYAEMWLKVAWRLHQNALDAQKAGDKSYAPVVLWAPTRTHVLEAWNSFWRAAKIPPNFVIRPSAYSVGDPAPYINRPSPTGAKGTAVLFEDDTRSRIKMKNGAEYGDGKKFDFQCGVYALDAGAKTCLGSIAPDGKKGCRACWKRRDLAINYVVH